MNLCIFKEFKHPLRKCLKEILIRWREWTSMGLVLPSRCALLAWLFKPLNLFEHKSSTKIAENNQYAPAALFTSQKLFPSIIPSLANSHLFFYPYPWLSSFLPFSPLSPCPCDPTSLSPLPQAEQASLSHVVDLLSLILLTAIWAVCPRDSLALLGQWVQGKLSQVRPRMLPTQFPYFHSVEGTLAFSHFTHSDHWLDNNTVLLYILS